MARLTRKDWLRKGLQVLSSKGYDSLRLEHLCEQLRVTRGSFYHHFRDIKDYVGKLMSFWEESAERLLREVGTGGTPEERLAQTQAAAFHGEHRLEVVIRAWSTFDKTVARHVRRVDRARLKSLTESYMETGLAERSAASVAKIEYAAYLGMQTMYYGGPKGEGRTLFQELERVLDDYGREKIG